MSQAAAPTRILDPHTHVWKNDARFPWARETGNPPAEDRTAEMLLELMSGQWQEGGMKPMRSLKKMMNLTVMRIRPCLVGWLSRGW